MTKNVKKLMPKNKFVQSYEMLKLASFLESLTTSKLRYYLHHNAIWYKIANTAKKLSFETVYQGLKFAFAYLISGIRHFQRYRTFSLKHINIT